MRNIFLFNLLFSYFVLLSFFNSTVTAEITNKYTIKEFLEMCDVSQEVTINLINFPEPCTCDLYYWDIKNKKLIGNDPESTLVTDETNTKQIISSAYLLDNDRVVIYCKSRNEAIQIPKDAEINRIAGNEYVKDKKDNYFIEINYNVAKHFKVAGDFSNKNKIKLKLSDVPKNEDCKLHYGRVYDYVLVEPYERNCWYVDFNEFGKYVIQCENRKSKCNESLHCTVATTSNNDDSLVLKINYNDLKLSNIPLFYNYSEKDKIPFPDKTTFRFNYIDKPSSWQLSEHVFPVDDHSRIEKKKILRVFQEFYKSYGDKFTIEILTHPNLPAIVFKKYKFENFKVLPSEIVVTQKNYAKIKLPKELPFRTTLEDISNFEWYKGFQFVVSSQELVEQTITFAGYKTLDLESCNMTDDKVLDPKEIRVPEVMSIVQKNEQGQEDPFPTGTTIELKYAYEKGGNMQSFKKPLEFTDMNSQIVSTDALKIFQKFYNLYGEYFELKVTGHPDLPEEIFENKNDFKNSDDMPEKITISRQNYAKIKVPSGFELKPETPGFKSERKKEFLYVWTKGINGDLSKEPIVYKGYDPLQLEIYSDVKNNVLELKKTKPVFVSIRVDNNVKQIKYLSEKRNSWVKLDKIKTIDDSHMFELPQNVLKQKTLKIKTTDSSVLEKELVISEEKPVIDNEIIYKLDFGKYLKLQLNTIQDGVSVKGISVNLKNNGDVLCKTVSTEQGEVLIRHKSLRNMDSSQLEIELIDDKRNEIFFKKNKFVGKDMIQKDGVYIVDLWKTSYFYLYFPEVFPVSIFIDNEDGKRLFYYVEDRKFKVEWKHIDKKLKMSTILPVNFPEFNVSNSFEPFTIDIQKLIRKKDFDFPVYEYKFPRYPYPEPQKIEITCSGEGWDDLDYKMIKIVTPFGEAFKMKPNSTRNKKITFELNIPSDDKRGFYYSSKVHIGFKKDKYKPIDKEEIMDFSKSVTRTSLELIPLHKDIYKISLLPLVDGKEKALSGYYTMEGTNQWISYESGSFAEEIYGPLNGHVRSDGYKPKKMKFDEPGGFTIDMGSSKLPLWIIINADKDINRYRKPLMEIIAKGIKRMIDEERLIKDQIWITVFDDNDDEIDKPKQFTWTGEDRMVSDLRKILKPNSSLHSEKILQQLISQEEKAIKNFANKGFNLYIISLFKEKYIAEREKKSFEELCNSFIEWLYRKEVSGNLSQLLLIDLDLGKKGNGKTKSSFGHIEGSYKENQIPFLHYLRKEKLTDLEEIF